MRRYEDPDGDGWKPPRQTRGRSRRKKSRGAQFAGWLAGLLVCALVVGALGAYVKYRTVYDSIKRVDASSLGKQPPKFTNALNILLIGSDSRTGGNGKIGGSTGCNCSDTVMLLHISPGHHLVTVISIPRDTEVPVVACKPSDGTQGQQAAPGEMEPINYTLSYGGPVCTWKTIDAVTHVHVDHFIQLDFTGFEKVVNDMGGVNVCLPEPVDDPKSGLHLSAGPHHVRGYQALAFWRTREDVGFGSDTQRIQRDQFLMAGLVQGMVHSGLLNSPTRILSVVTDAAKSMTVDTGMDQATMLKIADSMRGLSTKSVQFLTVPNGAYALNANKIQLQEPEAGQLFYAIAHDNKLPKPSKGKPGGAKHGVTDAVLTTSPSEVHVKVLNGAGINLLAAQVGTDLTNAGFDVVGTGDAMDAEGVPQTDYTNPVILYGSSADMPAVNTLKARFTGATVQQSSSVTPGTVEVIVGSAFTGLAPASSSASKAAVKGLSSAYGGITGNTKICSDQAAFAGPDT
ncbi:MAG TPA: LCP family protein [Streptosporangiaceae bacterium]|jgi:LCP family protein required for cell wall assembly